MLHNCHISLPLICSFPLFIYINVQLSIFANTCPSLISPSSKMPLTESLPMVSTNRISTRFEVPRLLHFTNYYWSAFLSQSINQYICRYSSRNASIFWNLFDNNWSSPQHEVSSILLPHPWIWQLSYLDQVCLSIYSSIHLSIQ